MDFNSASLVPTSNIDSNNLHQWTKLFGAVAIFRGSLIAVAVVYSVSLAAASFSDPSYRHNSSAPHGEATCPLSAEEEMNSQGKVTGRMRLSGKAAR